MNEVTQVAFDYSTVPQEDALQLRMAADRIRLRMKRTAEDIIEIGRDLISAKERIGHGGFGVWLEAEFQMSDSAATKFMQVADRFGDKNVIITDLKPSILYMLAAPSVPEPVIAQVTSGEIPATTAAVKEAIKEAKAEAKAAQEAAQEAEARAFQARQQLAMFQQERESQERETQSRIASLTRSIEAMRTEYEQLQHQKQTAKIEDRPETLQRMAALEASMVQLQREKTELAQQNKAIGEHAQKLQEEARQASLDRLHGE